MSRRSLSVSVVVLFFSVLLAGAYVLREHAIVRAPLMAIVFDHQDHFAVSCQTCHHNFFDDTGRDSCYFCHKQRPELALTVHRDFHHLCRDCHAHIANAGYDSGPVRRCDGCHDWSVTQEVVPAGP